MTATNASVQISSQSNSCHKYLVQLQTGGGWVCGWGYSQERVFFSPPAGGGAVSHHDNQHSIIDFWLNSESEKNEDLKNLDRPAGGLWSDSNKRRMEEKVDGVRNP